MNQDQVNESEANVSSERTESPRPAQEKQWRRVIVFLEVDGTSDQANVIRDAIGEAIDDEFLGAVVTDVIQANRIERVDWRVSGERWERGNFYEDEDESQSASAGRGDNNATADVSGV